MEFRSPTLYPMRPILLCFYSPTIKVNNIQQFQISGLIRHHRRKQSQQPLFEA